MAKYQLTKPYYAQGVFYAVGDFIVVPDGTKPGKSWVPVEAPVEAAPVEEKPKRGRPPGQRPSDTDPSTTQ